MSDIFRKYQTLEMKVHWLKALRFLMLFGKVYEMGGSWMVEYIYITAIQYLIYWTIIE